MVKNNKVRWQMFANKMHREVFLFIFLAMFIPVIITIVLSYYLIFNVTAKEIGVPETIVFTLVPASYKVVKILLTITPGVLLMMLVLAHKMTHAMVGPFDRLIHELEKCVDGEKKGPLKLRKGDKLWPLVHLINRLLGK